MSDSEIHEIWIEDRLDRQTDANFLIKFLLNRIDERVQRGAPRSYVLNLDAGWGHGKSFFLSRLGRQLAAQGYLVANVDSWRDDHAEDPLIAVMAAINDTLLPLIARDKKSKEIWRNVKSSFVTVAATTAKGVAKHYLKRSLGEETVEDIAEALDLSEDEKKSGIDAATKSVEKLIDDKADKLLNSFKEAQQSIENFRQNLSRFMDIASEREAKKPLFILVDELDRCRPTYAVKMLERVKHLFDTDGLVFVIATNTRQLRHSIGAVYGEKFDSDRYLSRFFDRQYTFEEKSVSSYTNYLFEHYKLLDSKFYLPFGVNLSKFSADCFEYYGLSLRDINQCVDTIRICATVWDKNVEIEFAALLPLVVAAQQNIEPAWSESMLDRLEGMRNTNNSASKTWKVSYRRAPSPEYPDHINVNVLEIFRIYMKYHSVTLDRIGSERPTSHTEQCINSRFGNEFNRIHANMYDPRNPPFSIIREYPRFIKSAGRLLS